jgi:uncharacterized membrane protein YfhO
VLVEAHSPGWRVSVDESEAPLLRANVAFRAVEVSAGRHRIEFLYRPRAALAGAGISACALALALVLAARGSGPNSAKLTV